MFGFVMHHFFWTPAGHAPSAGRDRRRPTGDDPPAERARRGPAAAALWDVSFKFLTVGNRSFWRSGRPRGPGRPFRWVGGFAPNLSEGSSGPPGPPRPQHGRSPILIRIMISVSPQTDAMREVGAGGLAQEARGSRAGALALLAARARLVHSPEGRSLELGIPLARALGLLIALVHARALARGAVVVLFA